MKFFEGYSKIITPFKRKDNYKGSVTMNLAQVKTRKEVTHESKETKFSLKYNIPV